MELSDFLGEDGLALWISYDTRGARAMGQESSEDCPDSLFASTYSVTS